MTKEKENTAQNETKENDAPVVEKFIPFSKKKSTKITLAVLIAAAVVSTAVTANALGGFGEAFSDMFIEESPNGMYSGEKITTESENNNVEFHSVAGDDLMASTSMTITRKDGGTFIDDVTDTWIAASPGDDMMYFSSYNKTDVTFTCPNWIRVRYSEEADTLRRDDICTSVDYYFENESTINAYTLTSASFGGIRGETMTVHAYDLSAYKQKEIVYDFSEHLDEFDDPNNILDDNYRRAIRKCLEKYGAEKKNGLILVINPDTKDLVLAEETPLDVDFTLNVKLVYKAYETKLNAEHLGKAVDGWGKDTKGSFRVSPFSITFDVRADIPTAQDFWTFGLTNSSVETSDQASGMGKFIEYLHMERPNAPKSLLITLADGTTVTAEDMEMSDEDLSSGKYSVVYRFFSDNGEGSKPQPTTIDAKDIQTIEANGVLVYKNE